MTQLNSMLPSNYDLTNSDLICFINHSAGAGCDIRSIFKRILAGFKTEFSFSLTSFVTKAKETSHPYYLPKQWDWERMIGFIPFSRVLQLYQMQSDLSRNWTLVAASISYDNNYYTSCTSIILFFFKLNKIIILFNIKV